MSIRDRNTRILTQSNIGGVITGFLIASFRTLTWNTGVPSNITQTANLALSVQARSAIIVRGSVAYVCDGGTNNFLYAVSVGNPANPQILSHVNIGA